MYLTLGAKCYLFEILRSQLLANDENVLLKIEFFKKSLKSHAIYYKADRHARKQIHTHTETRRVVGAEHITRVEERRVCEGENSKTTTEHFTKTMHRGVSSVRLLYKFVLFIGCMCVCECL